MSLVALFVLLFIAIFATVPIGISLGGATILTMDWFTSMDTVVSAQLGITGLDSFTLIAIPYFILAGELMSTGGISRRIVNMAHCFVKNLVGGLAIITTFACTFFAAISGSGPATVSAIGSMMIPEMEKEKYDKAWATAITCCGGIIGVIIPPSIPFVLFGVITGCSIGELFVAGVVPGLLICAVLCLYSFFACKKNSYGVEVMTDRGHMSTWATFKDSFAALMTPLIILGGIYAGIFTPTEAAIVANVWALIAGKFIYKELTWKTLKTALKNTALTTSSCLFTIACATSFGYLLTTLQVPAKFASFMMGLTSNKYLIMLMLLAFLLVIGCFMDNITSMTILTPIFVPIVTGLGYSLTHFGVFMTVALAIGFVTPPYGANLFVASGITGLSVTQISKKILPMIGVLILCLLVITFVPQITMWLPSVAYK